MKNLQNELMNKNIYGYKTTLYLEIIMFISTICSCICKMCYNSNTTIIMIIVSSILFILFNIINKYKIKQFVNSRMFNIHEYETDRFLEKAIKMIK